MTAKTLAALIAVVAALDAPSRADDRPDIVVADFESDTYPGWVSEGTAFGTGPARGNLPGQMTVSGFLGHGLVNSFRGGDPSTGTLTSPPFLVDRPYLNFLIGGGKYPEQTCIELLVDGRRVRLATGPNDKPGGSERLDWASWDVNEFIGRRAVLRIIDRHEGAWGHINVDQIVQSDRKLANKPVHRLVKAEARYLLLPVRNDAPVRRISVTEGRNVVRDFDIKLADGPADYQVFLDLTPFRGKTLDLNAELPTGTKALEAIKLSDSLPDYGSVDKGSGRPRFHFTSLRGWLNDPNGLVWHENEYHLFYQHNPYGCDSSGMHWGHAVSPDLFHWTELPIALYPKRYDDWVWSGSAVVDTANTSGFGAKGQVPLVAAFTSTGRGECIAFSIDRGRTWTEYDGNPVVRHAGRDPRLLWFAPTKRWVMAVYDEEGGKQTIAFHSSPDLKHWTFESKIPGFFECPELFEMPVEGNPGKMLWVLHAGDGQYLLGRFDGHRFEPESPIKQRVWYGHFYASQTFSNAPGGRRVQIGWANGIAFPGQPFNQQMNVPCELTLRPTPEGIRLFAMPVAEFSGLRAKLHPTANAFTLEPGQDVLTELGTDIVEIRLDAEVGDAGVLRLDGLGPPLIYDARSKSLKCGDVEAPLAPESGTIHLLALVDRGSIEVFGNQGRVALSQARSPAPGKPRVALSVPRTSPPVTLRLFRVNEIRSALP